MEPCRGDPIRQQARAVNLVMIISLFGISNVSFFCRIIFADVGTYRFVDVFHTVLIINVVWKYCNDYVLRVCSDVRAWVCMCIGIKTLSVWSRFYESSQQR